MRKIIFLPALLFAFLASSFLISGCIYQEAADWQRCTFDVASIQYLGVRENQTEWKIDLNVHNPGSHRLKMQGVRATALIEDDTLAVMSNAAPVDLAPLGDTKVAFNATSTRSGFDKAVASIKENGKCSVTIVGDAEYHGAFGSKKYPGLFHKTYDLDLATALGAMGSQLLQGMQGLPF